MDDKQCQECTTENRFIDKNSYTYERERNMKVEEAEAQLGQDNMAFGPDKFLRITNQTFPIGRTTFLLTTEAMTASW